MQNEILFDQSNFHSMHIVKLL